MDTLSTHLDEHDEYKSREQRDIPSDDGEGGKEPEHDTRTTAATRGAAHASATFKRQATERDTERDKAQKEKDKAAHERRREQQRCEAETKNRDKNGGKMTSDKTRDWQCGASRPTLLPRFQLYAPPLKAELAGTSKTSARARKWQAI
eukprot:jgi/Tetstr1/431620/TSEL_021150.t1